MRVLVVGGGGREHALAWKLAQSPRVTRVFVAPGNAGTATEPKVENRAIDVGDIAALIACAQAERVDLTVIGPEVPLVAGIVDAFVASGLKCLGPTRAAAQLEGSKSFAKAFLARHHIPTAAFATFTDPEEARAYLRGRALPIVIKADGLAAGKGVVIAETRTEGDDAIAAMLADAAFGAAGQRIVIEEFLRGEEASFICLVDGQDVVAFASAQDHKARDDGDRGPNTGGMGAYSPAPVVDDAMHARIMDEVIRPTLRGLAADGIRYRGFLYAGLMIGEDGTPRVLEFNCRFGDPETQPILMRLRSDFAVLCLAACDGTLGGQRLDWDPRAALGVVLAAGGYPGSYRTGDAIEGLEHGNGADCKVFHAGTVLDAGAVRTSGGRVLCVCALGESVGIAQERAYRRIRQIHWPDEFHRTDIGHRAIARERKR
ncbi:MAG: phosphoribosylamine--glycine ligase [Gammaproteobacteria bacterium]|nr:phosphoribosylamine--glycine ligase [Gammaproteobacteria bacterium]